MKFVISTNFPEREDVFDKHKVVYMYTIAIKRLWALVIHKRSPGMAAVFGI